MSIDVDSIIRRVTETIRTETVVGEPLTVGAVTLIPIINVSFGFGAGGGRKDEDESDDGTGAGGGARMTVAGMIVVKGDDVSFVPTSRGTGKPGALDKILDSLPELIEKISDKASKVAGERSAE